MSFTDFGEQIFSINPVIDQGFGQVVQPLARLLGKIHKAVFSDQSPKHNKVQW